MPPGAHDRRRDAFISYARKDAGFVLERLCPALEQRGKRVWVDVSDIPPAAEWPARIRAAIEAARAFVYVVTPDAVASRECARELDAALEMSKPIVPVLHRETDDLHDALRQRNWIWIAQPSQFEHGVELLVDALETDLEWRDQHAQLTERASEWLRANHDEGYLLRGSGLAAAEEWLEQAPAHRERPTPAQIEYITESRVTMRVRRRLAGQALGSRVLEGTPDDPELGLLVALAGIDEHGRSPRLVRALHRALVASRVRLAVWPKLPVHAIDFSPDGLLVTGAAAEGAGGIVQVWDREGREQLRLPGEWVLLSDVAWSPDGSQIATAGTRMIDGHALRELAIWNAATGERRLALNADAGCNSLDWSPDGTRLAAAMDKHAGFTVWDASTGEGLLAFTSLWRVRVLGVAWSPDGEQIATACADGVAVLLDAEDAHATASLGDPDDSTMFAVAWSPDGTRLATASALGTARVWDPATGANLATCSERSTRELYDVAWAPTGDRIATASHNQWAHVWDATNGEPLVEFRGHSDELTCVKWLGAGLVATASRDGSARVWWTAVGEQRLTLDHGLHGGARQTAPAVPAVAWSPDGRLVATATYCDTVAWVWDAASGALVHKLAGHAEMVGGVAWSPTANQLITCSHDATAYVWDAATGELVFRLIGHEEEVYAAAWSPDGTRIATSSGDATVRIWDAANGRPLLELRKENRHTLLAIAWSPDGERIASGSSGAFGNWVLIRDSHTGETYVEVKGHAHPVAALDWSPDGDRIVTASVDRTLRLWNAHTGAEILKVDQPAPVQDVAWSPDGRRLAVALSDAVCVLPGEGGEAMLEYQVPGAETLAWNPAGDAVVTGGVVSRVWDAPETDELIELAHRRVFRSLTDDERESYGLSESDAAMHAP